MTEIQYGPGTVVAKNVAFTGDVEPEFGPGTVVAKNVAFVGDLVDSAR